MMIWALFSGVLTGLALGIFGSGGGIIVVPALVYLLHLPPKEAIAMGLGIIAITAVLSAWDHWRAGNVDMKTAASFAPVGVAGSFAGAQLGAGVPVGLQLGLFAFVMYMAAYRMLRAKTQDGPSVERSALARWALLGGAGGGVGLLAGIVGVGGGFLIVPALVLVAEIPMKQAIGTSLAVVSLNSLSGFIGYAGAVSIDYAMMAMFAGVTVISSLAGSRLARHWPADRLKRGFAWGLVLVASYIIVKSVV